MEAYIGSKTSYSQRKLIEKLMGGNKIENADLSNEILVKAKRLV